MTADLIRLLDHLPPGESMVYFTGKLDTARALNAEADAVRVANIAYALYQQGKIVLTQRRLSTGEFEYIATGAKPKRNVGL